MECTPEFATVYARYVVECARMGIEPMSVERAWQLVGALVSAPPFDTLSGDSDCTH